MSSPGPNGPTQQSAGRTIKHWHTRQRSHLDPSSRIDVVERFEPGNRVRLHGSKADPLGHPSFPNEGYSVINFEHGLVDRNNGSHNGIVQLLIFDCLQSTQKVLRNCNFILVVFLCPVEALQFGK